MIFLGYHCLPLRITLVSDREFKFYAYFEVLYSLWLEDSLKTLKVLN